MKGKDSFILYTSYLEIFERLSDISDEAHKYTNERLGILSLF